MVKALRSLAVACGLSWLGGRRRAFVSLVLSPLIVALGLVLGTVTAPPAGAQAGTIPWAVPPGVAGTFTTVTSGGGVALVTEAGVTTTGAVTSGGATATCAASGPVFAACAASAYAGFWMGHDVIGPGICSVVGVVEMPGTGYVCDYPERDSLAAPSGVTVSTSNACTQGLCVEYTFDSTADYGAGAHRFAVHATDKTNNNTITLDTRYGSTGQNACLAYAYHSAGLWWVGSGSNTTTTCPVHSSAAATSTSGGWVRANWSGCTHPAALDASNFADSMCKLDPSDRARIIKTTSNYPNTQTGTRTADNWPLYVGGIPLDPVLVDRGRAVREFYRATCQNAAGTSTTIRTVYGPYRWEYLPVPGGATVSTPCLPGEVPLIGEDGVQTPNRSTGAGLVPGIDEIITHRWEAPGDWAAPGFVNRTCITVGNTPCTITQAEEAGELVTRWNGVLQPTAENSINTVEAPAVDPDTRPGPSPEGGGGDSVSEEYCNAECVAEGVVAAGSSAVGLGECLTGAFSWNPVDWILTPVKCALSWAFVPPGGFDTAITGFQANLDQSEAAGPMLEVMDTVTGSFATDLEDCSNVPLPEFMGYGGGTVDNPMCTNLFVVSVVLVLFGLGVLGMARTVVVGLANLRGMPTAGEA